jgi:hypothetical protein
MEKNQTDISTRTRRDLNYDEDIEDTSKEFADTDYEFDCSTAVTINYST